MKPLDELQLQEQRILSQEVNPGSLSADLEHELFDTRSEMANRLLNDDSEHQAQRPLEFDSHLENLLMPETARQYPDFREFMLKVKKIANESMQVAQTLFGPFKISDGFNIQYLESNNRMAIRNAVSYDYHPADENGRNVPYATQQYQPLFLLVSPKAFEQRGVPGLDIDFMVAHEIGHAIGSPVVPNNDYIHEVTANAIAMMICKARGIVIKNLLPQIKNCQDLTENTTWGIPDCSVMSYHDPMLKDAVLARAGDVFLQAFDEEWQIAALMRKSIQKWSAATRLPTKEEWSLDPSIATLSPRLNSDFVRDFLDKQIQPGQRLVWIGLSNDDPMKRGGELVAMQFASNPNLWKGNRVTGQIDVSCGKFSSGNFHAVLRIGERQIPLNPGRYTLTREFITKHTGIPTTADTPISFEAEGRSISI